MGSTHMHTSRNRGDYYERKGTSTKPKLEPYANIAPTHGRTAAKHRGHSHATDNYAADCNFYTFNSINASRKSILHPSRLHARTTQQTAIPLFIRPWRWTAAGKRNHERYLEHRQNIPALEAATSRTDQGIAGSIPRSERTIQERIIENHPEMKNYLENVNNLDEAYKNLYQF